MTRTTCSSRPTRSRKGRTSSRRPARESISWNPMRSAAERPHRPHRLDHETVTLHTFFPRRARRPAWLEAPAAEDRAGECRRRRRNTSAPDGGRRPLRRRIGTIRAVAAEDETVLERAEDQVDAFSGERSRGAAARARRRAPSSAGCRGRRLRQRKPGRRSWLRHASAPSPRCGVPLGGYRPVRPPRAHRRGALPA